MKYFCPVCKHEMEGIFCDCQIIAGVDLIRREDGRFYHRCGKPLTADMQKHFEELERRLAKA